MPRKKGRASGKNKLRKDCSFLIRMLELYQVLGYAKFYSFVPEMIRVAQM